MYTYIIRKNDYPIAQVKGRKNAIGRINQEIAENHGKDEWFTWSKNGAKSPLTIYKIERGTL
jgi:hypothetical protein